MSGRDIAHRKRQPKSAELRKHAFELGTPTMLQNKGNRAVRRQRVTADSLLMDWEREFRAGFASDAGSGFERLIQHIGIKTDPLEMLRGTIDVVSACWDIRSLDGANVSKFLADQRYEAGSSGATYALIIDLLGRSSARLLVRPDMKTLDLADLYEFRWERLRVAGFRELWLTRTDGADLSNREIVDLEEVVSGDIYFDYSEDDISIIFDPDTYPGALSVSVYERIAD